MNFVFSRFNAMPKSTLCKIAPTPYFPTRNACFSGAFLPSRIQDCVESHHSVLKIQDTERFSWGLTPGCISGQKIAFRSGNSGVKRIAGIVKILDTFSNRRNPNCGKRQNTIASGGCVCWMRSAVRCSPGTLKTFRF